MPAAKRVPVIVWTVKELTTDEHVRLRQSAQAIFKKSGNEHSLVDELSLLLGRPVAGGEA
jgi:hypothetical protein